MKRLNMMLIGYSGNTNKEFVSHLFEKQNLCEKQFVLLEKNAKKFSAYSQTVNIADAPITYKKREMTVIQPPILGMELDYSRVLQDIYHYVTGEYVETIINERKENRRKFSAVDNKIHCIVYFLMSGATHLTQVDAFFMKKLGKYTNLIPVVSVPSSYDPECLERMRSTISAEIINHKIQTYAFSECLTNISIENDTSLYLDKNLPLCFSYDSKECECFGRLKSYLLSYDAEQLITKTNEEHYEMFREDVLSSRINIGEDVYDTSLI